MESKIRVICAAFVLSILPITSFAANLLAANYHHHIHLSSNTPGDIHLLKFTTDSWFISVTRDDENRLTISDTPSHYVNDGVTTATYGTNDQSRFCLVTFRDGIGMSDPMVQNVDCTGLTYHGMVKDSSTEYQYGIVLSYT